MPKFTALLLFLAILNHLNGLDDCAKPCKKGLKCVLGNCVLDVKNVCPLAAKFGPGPPDNCSAANDPNGLPPSPMEDWFTEELFNELFPFANLGWGPHKCSPYNYESFKLAARYFPEFGNESPDNGYTTAENHRRDLATFFAHAVQETGENNADLYKNLKKPYADACFYRGGFYNWFEGGPTSAFLPKENPGYTPESGDQCSFAGRYCIEAPEILHFYPCNRNKTGQSLFKGCYFGRGAIQISYNFNYGQFNQWLAEQNIFVDLLENPNAILTHREPPLAILASLWFYMTPQPPKPAMHDLILGNWEPGDINRAAGFEGPIFGPTSLIINNECNGEERQDPGGPGENRRIKAFRWFTDFFGVHAGKKRTMTCKKMPQPLEQIRHALSWQPDWSRTWREEPCQCAPATYGGMIPYFQPGFYPPSFVAKNGENRLRCIESIYDAPKIYGMEPSSSRCLNHKNNQTDALQRK